MKQIGLLAAVVVCATLGLPRAAAAQTAPALPPSITTPDNVDTRLGTLDFKDGVPSEATLDKVYYNLDFTYAYRAFMDNMRGVSIHALRQISIVSSPDPPELARGMPRASPTEASAA
jgi:hypothetical protein